MGRIERNPVPRIRGWLDAGNNWDRAEYVSYSQIAREVGISRGALTYHLRIILKVAWDLASYEAVDDLRSERQRERRLARREGSR